MSIDAGTCFNWGVLWSLYSMCKGWGDMKNIFINDTNCKLCMFSYVIVTQKITIFFCEYTFA